jgi:hypothetical protein
MAMNLSCVQTKHQIRLPMPQNNVLLKHRCKFAINHTHKKLVAQDPKEEGDDGSDDGGESYFLICK